MSRVECDVLVVGSGAGGFMTALAADDAGLEVILTEKASVFGGTSALSGGIVWLPANARAAAEGDTREAAMTYLRHEIGNRIDETRINAYLDAGNEAIALLERVTPVRFSANPIWSDYHSDLPGAAQGFRSLQPDEFDGRRLGGRFRDLRLPLPTAMLFGGMMVGRFDIPHLLNFRRSPRSALHVARMLGRYVRDRVFHRRGTRLTNGNALVAAMATGFFGKDMPLWLDSPLERLIVSDGRVTGAIVQRRGRPVEVLARRGVVLACGGFSWAGDLLNEHFSHVASGGTHRSVVPETNRGEGIRAALSAGAAFDANADHPAAWAPVSMVPQADGSLCPFPHFLERGKPGVIAVDARGRRFVNEAVSYHDFVPAMIAATPEGEDARAFIVAAHATFRKYGIGAAPAAPASYAAHLRSGYLTRADTLGELARKLGLPPEALEATVRRFNETARNGDDPEFGKGSTNYQRFNGDARNKPNPCVGPVGEGPYYAVKVVPGDLGTFMGLSTDPDGRVLTAEGAALPGLFAVGNDSVSVWSGHYPGAGGMIGPALVFGYRAARRIAADARG